MNAVPIKLSETALVILGRAAERDDRLTTPPPKLPPAARSNVIGSLVRKRLVEKVRAPAPPPGLAWGEDDDGTAFGFRITDNGLRAIKVELPALASAAPLVVAEPPLVDEEGPVALGAAQEPSVAAATPSRRETMLGTVAAVLAAWRDLTVQGIEVPDALREGLERLAFVSANGAAVRSGGAVRPLRQGTKQEAVLALLRRPEGASGPVIAEATGWAPHTVRGFLANLAKKGIAVEVLERVRQSGPKGSFSVYRLAEVTGGTDR